MLIQGGYCGRPAVSGGDEHGCERLGSEVLRGKAERERAVALEDEPDVDEDHADDGAGLVVVDGVALGSGDRTGGLAWWSDAEVEHVAAIVVLVLVEVGAGDL